MKIGFFCVGRVGQASGMTAWWAVVNVFDGGWVWETHSLTLLVA